MYSIHTLEQKCRHLEFPQAVLHLLWWTDLQPEQCHLDSWSLLSDSGIWRGRNNSLGQILLCPTGKKEIFICSCRPVRILHIKHAIRYLFLFCPLQLSAWKWTYVSPNPWVFKKWWSMDMIMFPPLPTLEASSIK